MNYTTPPQPPDLDDWVRTICITCGIIAIMAFIGILIF